MHQHYKFQVLCNAFARIWKTVEVWVFLITSTIFIVYSLVTKVSDYIKVLYEILKKRQSWSPIENFKFGCTSTKRQMLDKNLSLDHEWLLDSSAVYRQRDEEEAMHRGHWRHDSGVNGLRSIEHLCCTLGRHELSVLPVESPIVLTSHDTMSNNHFVCCTKILSDHELLFKLIPTLVLAKTKRS